MVQNCLNIARRRGVCRRHRRDALCFIKSCGKLRFQDERFCEYHHQRMTDSSIGKKSLGKNACNNLNEGRKIQENVDLKSLI